MSNKKLWLGILVMVLVFGFLLTGCELDLGLNGYTFEFKVENTTWRYGDIIKVEFFNGSNENATVLATEEMNIVQDQMSSVYRVSGFTEKADNESRIFGVKFTTTTGSFFNWASARNKAKKILQLNGDWGKDYIHIYDGNW